MFTLTSTSTKLAVLAFSAALSTASFSSVVLSFQTVEAPVTVVELPTVVVIGQRATLGQGTVQASLKTIAKTAI
jgi:hypothetical protein